MPHYPKYTTTVIGAYSVPRWYEPLDRLVTMGQLLPEDMGDAQYRVMQAAIIDQEIAGIDVITGGETHRRTHNRHAPPNAMLNYFWLYKGGVISIPTDQGANFVSSIVAFVVGAVVMVIVSYVTKPKPAEKLEGLVYGTRSPGMDEIAAEGDDAWYRKPALLGWGAVVLAALCYIPFSF